MAADPRPFGANPGLMHKASQRFKAWEMRARDAGKYRFSGIHGRVSPADSAFYPDLREILADLPRAGNKPPAAIWPHDAGLPRTRRRNRTMAAQSLPAGRRAANRHPWF
jgi:hypothetical protein